jgi:hypothetical protein
MQRVTGSKPACDHRQGNGRLFFFLAFMCKCCLTRAPNWLVMHPRRRQQAWAMEKTGSSGTTAALSTLLLLSVACRPDVRLPGLRVPPLSWARACRPPGACATALRQGRAAEHARRRCARARARAGMLRTARRTLDTAPHGVRAAAAACPLRCAPAIH